MAGPTLLFHSAATLALTGAEFAASVDGKPIPMWQAVSVAAGSTLAIGLVAIYRALCSRKMNLLARAIVNLHVFLSVCESCACDSVH
jgi:urea carboxylase